MCLMGQYMWCVMWLTAPLPCCPAFKLSSSSGCLSPGVDCIFYLSFSPSFALSTPAQRRRRRRRKKFWGENCNQHNMPSSCCVLACHPPLSMSMQDETDSPCRRGHTHAHTDARTTPLCVYQPPHIHTHTHTFSLPLSVFHKHWPKKKKKMTPLPSLSLLLTIFHTHLLSDASQCPVPSAEAS